jgi:hypothetical protein
VIDLVKLLPTVAQVVAILLGVLYALSAFANAVMRLLPAPWVVGAEKRWPRVAHVLRACRKAGGDLIPALQSLYRALTGAPFSPNGNDTPPVRATQPAPPGNAGFISVRALQWIAGALIVGVPVIVAAIAVHGCSASQVHVEAVSADATARAFNRAAPLVVAEYERTGREEIAAVCCDRANMLAAMRTHDARWSTVMIAWELAHVAHDSWRAELMACQAQPTQQCTESTIQLAGAFVVALGRARCSVHALGRPDLDPLAEVLPSCGSPDGGAS